MHILDNLLLKAQCKQINTNKICQEAILFRISVVRDFSYSDTYFNVCVCVLVYLGDCVCVCLFWFTSTSDGIFHLSFLLVSFVDHLVH